MDEKMKILISMAGDGKRFKDAGYTDNKAVLPMIYRKTGEKCPMVICAVKDLPGIEAHGKNLAFIMRDFHKQAKMDRRIREWYSEAAVFSIKNLTQGQVCTCLLAESFIEKDDELLIAACDNGIEYSKEDFKKLKKETDALVFTFRHDPRVCEQPDAFGWVKVHEGNVISEISVKKHISDKPENDHAIVGTFWFRTGNIFMEAAKKLIQENDRVNNEFYVDQMINHVLKLGYRAHVFDVKRFLNYGSPVDYENYKNKIKHFSKFIHSKSYIGD